MACRLVHVWMAHGNNLFGQAVSKNFRALPAVLPNGRPLHTFSTVVYAKGNVETWLSHIESMMKVTVLDQWPGSGEWSRVETAVPRPASLLRQHFFWQPPYPFFSVALRPFLPQSVRL